MSLPENGAEVNLEVSAGHSILQRGFRNELKPKQEIKVYPLNELIIKAAQESETIDELIQKSGIYSKRPPHLGPSTSENRAFAESQFEFYRQPDVLQALADKWQLESDTNHSSRKKSDALRLKDVRQNRLTGSQKAVLIRVLPSMPDESLLENPKPFFKISNVRTMWAPPPEQVLSKSDPMRGAEAYRNRIESLGYEVSHEQAAHTLDRVRRAVDDYSDDGL